MSDGAALERIGLRSPSFVGREDAKRALEAAVERALRFDAPQFVTLMGPPGMGKSRFLSEWTGAKGAHERFRVLRIRTTDLRRDSEVEPFGLLGAIVRARFGIDEGAEDPSALEHFRNELSTVFGDRRVAEVAGLLGRFLGLALPDSPLAQALATRPDQETELGRAVLCRFLEADAAQQPLIIAIDDVHLADDRSLDVLADMAAEIGEAPLVMVVTARPELFVRRPSWGRGQGSQARVELTPLSRLEMDVFIRSVLAADTLASGLAERAAAESRGNPALLAQLLRLYQQHGLLTSSEGGPVRLDETRAESVSLELDPEAQAHQRLAQLTPAERELLRRAAAFGPVFWTGGVVALGRLYAEPPDPQSVFAPDPTIEEVRRLLSGLAERDFVLAQPVSTVSGEAEWSFCHELERVLVCGPIDPERLHQQQRFAAQWLEGKLQTPATSERLELLGNLYQEGGDPRRAGQCFLAAGDAAHRRRRHERARALYLRGLGLLDLDDCVRQIDAYQKLGDLSARLGRTREALGHFATMLRLAWRLDLPGKGGIAHGQIGRLYRALGDLKRALDHLNLGHVLFQLAGDRAGVAAALDDIGRIHFVRGQIDQSMSCHRSALAIREELHDARGIVLTLSWMGLCDMQGGNLVAAGDSFRRSLAVARANQDPHGIVSSLLDLGRLEREAGRLGEAGQHLKEARDLAQQMGERLYECQIGLQMGECLLAEGKPAEAQAELLAARTTAQSFGAKRLAAEAARGIAEARLAQGDAPGARDHAAQALGYARAVDAFPLQAAALRVMASAVAAGASVELEQGSPRDMFDRAIELLANAGAELELGRTLAAYADFEERNGHGETALELRGQADGIFHRVQPPLPAPADAAPAPA